MLKANEELEAANEDMIVTQEELQARLEELQTTNEELQADFEGREANWELLQVTNQELETTNEELQISSKGLVAANEELKARVGELQAQNVLLAEERRHLAEVVERAPLSVVMLRGPELRIESFNALSARLLSVRETLGRPLVEAAGRFGEGGVPLVKLASEVYQQGKPRTFYSPHAPIPATGEQGQEGGQVYTLLPAHDATGKISGVIIYAVDEAGAHENTAEESHLVSS